MRGSFFSWPVHCISALFMSVAAAATVRADSGDSQHGHHGRPPVYQRRAFEWKSHGHFNKRHQQWSAPSVSSGWFQRPYPYHLDYYKMRYGGSYAPYFGNLYGTPQIVTAPPYFGPYYGNFGMGEAGPNGTFYGPPADAPPTDFPHGAPNGDALPAP